MSNNQALLALTDLSHDMTKKLLHLHYDSYYSDYLNPRDEFSKVIRSKLGENVSSYSLRGLTELKVKKHSILGLHYNGVNQKSFHYTYPVVKVKHWELGYKRWEITVLDKKFNSQVINVSYSGEMTSSSLIFPKGTNLSKIFISSVKVY